MHASSGVMKPLRVWVLWSGFGEDLQQTLDAWLRQQKKGGDEIEIVSVSQCAAPGPNSGTEGLQTTIFFRWSEDARQP